MHCKCRLNYGPLYTWNRGFFLKIWISQIFLELKASNSFQTIHLLSCTKCNDFFGVCLRLYTTVSLLRKELDLPIGMMYVHIKGWTIWNHRVTWWCLMGAANGDNALDGNELWLLIKNWSPCPYSQNISNGLNFSENVFSIL